MDFLRTRTGGGDGEVGAERGVRVRVKADNGGGVRHASLCEETEEEGVEEADKASPLRSGSNGELEGEE